MKRRYTADITNGKIDSKYLSQSFYPVGSVIMQGYNNINMMGWKKCNGSFLSKNDYPELFDIIGYIYGGSGNTFQLPDLRGFFVRGLDNMGNLSRNVDSGRTIGSSQIDDFITHSHTMSGSFLLEGTHTHATINNNLSYDGGHYHDFLGMKKMKGSSECESGWPIYSVNGILRFIHPHTTQENPYLYDIVYYQNTTTNSHSHNLNINNIDYLYSSYSHTHSHNFSINNNNGTETRPQNVALNYIIRVK